MVRTVNSKYGFWLAGYYDDFSGARGIPSDTNQPSATDSFSHHKSHFGNPMNGEATLSPRYRWSYVERAKANNYDADLIGSDDAEQRLSNTGSFNWLGCDTIRQNPSDWEGKAQLQYPDGHIGNKYRYNNAAGASYLILVNGHDTLGRYIIPLGENDATFGRTINKNFTVTNYENKNAGGKDITQSGDFIQRAHLAGVWMGEMTEFDHKDGGTIESPRVVFQPVRSPSGKPILCVQSFHDDPTAHGTKSAIIYDNSINSVKDGDIFTVRFAIRSFNGASSNNGKVPPMVKLSLGYDSGPSSTTLDNGLTGTPEIVWSMNFDTGNGLKGTSYDYYGALYDNSTTPASYTEYDAWIDLDFVMDYTTGKFKVYHDGTEITATNDSAGAYSSGYSMASGAGVSAEDMYGWDMQAYPVTGHDYASITLMMDRAALYRPLTDHPAGDDLPQVSDMRMKSPVNGFSSLSLTMTDDPGLTGSKIGEVAADYTTQLTTLFSDNMIRDWLLLVFTNPTRGYGEATNRIDRPTWKGVCEKLSITQHRRSRMLVIRANDMLSIMDRQVPLWEVGQGGLNNSESNTPYWLYDAQGFNTLMYLGTTPLRNLKPTLGFDVDDNYLERIDQRTQLTAGNPIQMYNNENTDFGPNSIEKQYEGVGIIGFGQEDTTIDSVTAIYSYVDLRGNPGFTTSSVVTILNSETAGGVAVPANNIVDKSPVQVTTLSNGNQRLHFATADLPFTPDAASKIAYAGKYTNMRLIEEDFDGTGGSIFTNDHYLYGLRWNRLRFLHPNINDPTDESHYTFYFDGDPGLVPGDTFTVPIESNADGDSYPTIAGTHSCISIEKVLNYHYGFPTLEFSGSGPDTTSSMTGGAPENYWIVTTDTPYHINAETTLGTQSLGGSVAEGSNEISVADSSDFRSGSYFGQLWVQTASINGVPIIYKELDDDGGGTQNLSGVFAFAEVNEGMVISPPDNLSFCHGLAQTITGDLDNIVVKQGTEIGIYWDRDARYLDPYWTANPPGIYSDLEGGNTQLLRGTARVHVSTARGQMIPIPSAVDKNIGHKVVHARWMRDLPLSLWFRYHFGNIKKTPLVSYQIANGTTVNSASNTIEINSATYTALATVYSGIGEIVDSNGSADTFIWKGRVSSGGNYYLIGVEYISKSHTGTNPLTSTYPKINILDLDDSYKHLWLLWSDMRNNGRADAAGGFRKTKFGLMYPKAENYDVGLYYTDQDENMDGIMDKFTDLKLGEDYEMWEIDATLDPSTGGAWSKPADYSLMALVTSVSNNGSDKMRLNGFDSTTNFTVGSYAHIYNSTAIDGVYKVLATNAAYLDLDTAYVADSGTTGGIHVAPAGGSEIDYLRTDSERYRNWEDKGGAFLILDSAKFFNLNTTINNGKSGQTAGGSTDLEDYIATIAGDPVLIDSYWKEGPASYFNVGAPYNSHPHESSLVTNYTTLVGDAARGRDYLLPTDISLFDDTGFARVTGIKEATAGSTNPTLTEYFALWRGKNTTERSGTITTAPTYGGAGLVTLTDSSATFQTHGIKAGMYIQNTTNPITATALNVVGAEYWWRITAVNSETEIEVKLMGYIYDGTILTMRQIMEENLYGEAWGLQSVNFLPTVYRLWASTNAYTIPAQLYGVFGTSTTSITGAATNTPVVNQRMINRAMHNAGERFQYFNGELLQTSYDTIQISNSIAPSYILRLMMQLEGFARDENSGTFFDSDKFRAIWNAGIMETWLPKTRISCMFDINNVPNTRRMTTYNSTSTNDSYGSVFDSRSKTIWSSIQGIERASGIGTTNSYNTSFSYLMGRDGRFEYRPKYNSGHDLSRDNLMVSDLKTDVTNRITHVRVYYRNGQAFVDYPNPDMTDTTRWKVIELNDIFSDEEALSIAKKEYTALKNSRLSITAEPIKDTTTDDKMLSHGKFGYIADPQRAMQGYNDNANGYQAKYWSILGTGGVLFPGMINGMDGNMYTATTGEDGNPDIYQRWGKSGSIDSSSANIDWDENYYWYGSNSVNYAVQLVHVPAKCPAVSDTTGEEMRVGVWLKIGQTGTDIDNAEFTIGFLDYSYTTTSSAKGGGAPTLDVDNREGMTTKDVKDSGFYELEVPASYSSTLNSAGASFVVSFNAEYCRALLRHRCGDPAGASVLLNAHDVFGVTTFGSHNTASIFPLGLRSYAEMSSYADDRTEWYAPRIYVAPDYSYIPGTYVKYTDAGLNLSNETMVITQVNWSVNERNTESVALRMERDESLGAGGIISYLFPTISIGRQGPTIYGSSETGSATNIMGSWANSQTQQVAYQPSSAYGFGVTGQDPSPQIPTGGSSQATPHGGGTNISSDFTSNRLSDSLMNRVKEKMALNDMTIEGGFGILGQKKPSAAPSLMRGASTSSNVDIRPSGGAAFSAGNGLVLPVGGTTGEAFTDTSSVSSKVSGRITIPKDVTTNEISLSSTLTLNGASGGTGKGIIRAKVTCLNNNKSVSAFCPIDAPTARVTTEILPLTNLEGVETPGNILQIDVFREAGFGGDTSPNAIVISDLNINLRRGAVSSSSPTDSFTPQTS